MVTMVRCIGRRRMHVFMSNRVPAVIEIKLGDPPSDRHLATLELSLAEITKLHEATGEVIRSILESQARG